ncbi:MAG: NUDIX hydrolase [Cytophagales bacterium]|nr:NUDIX hydrolase [Cytophagales bacterium]MDW8383681.1 NUDIX hydrolase [Flammeovirgaceae bacterium]
MTILNPWRVHYSRLVYENPWIKVREDSVTAPTGKEGIYGVVSFKNYAIGIIPVDKQFNTWIVGQYRYPLNLYSWEIPMGGGKKTDTPEATALRELREETGLIAQKLTQIMILHTSNCVTDEVGYVFLAEDLIEGKTEFDETEKLEIRKLPLVEAIRMAENNEITDAISVAGLLKVARLFRF